MIERGRGTQLSALGAKLLWAGKRAQARLEAHVASGLADAGLGIEAAAAQFKLAFVPLAVDCYFLAMHKDVLERREGKLLVGLLRGDAFHDALTALHGARAHRTGEIARLEDTPPWNALLSAAST